MLSLSSEELVILAFASAASETAAHHIPREGGLNVTMGSGSRWSSIETFHIPRNSIASGSSGASSERGRIVTSGGPGGIGLGLTTEVRLLDGEGTEGDAGTGVEAATGGTGAELSVGAAV